MIDAAVVEAILAIPGAWHASRELLSRRKPDSQAVLRELDTMRANLVTFSAVGSWFTEAKELHQNLQNVDVALEQCDELYVRATALGGFDPQAYPLGEVRRCWNSANTRALNRLVASFESMRYVKKTALVEVGEGRWRRIPQWGEETVQFKRRIDAVFAEVDRHPSPSADQKREAADALNALVHHIKRQMILADCEIRDQAIAISNVLADVARDLKHG
jgi:hypothetical protein